MQTSPMLLSKISGTKKRLSESALADSALSSLALCGLLMILTYTSRVMTLGGSWGLIPVDIPVVSQPFADGGAHNYQESPASTVSASTMVIAMTPNELIFGDLNAFTTQKSDVRNKFMIPHKEGSPQIKGLLKQAEEWSLDRKNRLGIRTDRLVVVVPDPAVPVAVVSGVIERLRESGKFSHVVLGGGLL